jgi:hypothetical protein
MCSSKTRKLVKQTTAARRKILDAKRTSATESAKPRLNMVVIGHVDAGKVLEPCARCRWWSAPLDRITVC